MGMAVTDQQRTELARLGTRIVQMRLDATGNDPGALVEGTKDMPRRDVEDWLRAEDEAKRTTCMGLFNYAETYFRSARALNANKPKVTHPDDPVNFLFYHAIELYLKAYLRLKGHTPRELAGRKFGHSVGALSKRASELGQFLMDEDKEVLQSMEHDDAVIRSRYIKVGAFRRPTHGALDRTCKSFRQTIGEELLADGQPVRGIRRGDL